MERPEPRVRLCQIERGGGKLVAEGDVRAVAPLMKVLDWLDRRKRSPGPGAEAERLPMTTRNRPQRHPIGADVVGVDEGAERVEVEVRRKLIGSDFALCIHGLRNRDRGHGVRPARIEREMGDDPGQFAGRHSVVVNPRRAASF